MSEILSSPPPDPERGAGGFRLGSLMVVIAGIALVMAITPRTYLPIVAIFTAVATAAAAVVRLSTGVRWLTAFAWVTALYPFLAVGLVYAFWFAAWIELGHIPRPALDDPRDINGVAAPAKIAAAIGFQAMGAAFFAAIPLILVRLHTWMTMRPRQEQAATTLMLAGIAAWGSAFLLVIIDPLSVFFWYFD